VSSLLNHHQPASLSLFFIRYLASLIQEASSLQTIMRFQTVLAAVLPALVIAAPTPQDPDYEFPADVPEEGIVGGTAARAGEFPFIVSLRRANGQHFCGGSLLNANTVITAAHCSVPKALAGPVSGITVRAGSLVRIPFVFEKKNRGLIGHAEQDIWWNRCRRSLHYHQP
jgi:hypothetical protein